MFHRSADQEATFRAWHHAYVEALRDCTRVLDFGCGTGVFLEMLRERGITGLGIDRDPQMVAQTRERGLDAVEGDASTLAAYHGEFDGIHAAHVLETMWGDEVVAFLRSAREALKPDGILVLRAWNWENREVRERTFWFEVTHKRPYSLVTLREVLVDLGMHVVGAGYEPDGSQDVYVVARAPAAPMQARPLSARRDRPLLVWEGELQTLNSLSIVNRELGRVLAQSDALAVVFRADEVQPDPLVATDPRFEALRAKIDRTPMESDVFVRHPSGDPSFERPPTGTYVQIAPWEYGALPARWVTQMKKSVDEVWCPSSYVRRMYLEAGFDPERVVVIPNGVDPQIFAPGESDSSVLAPLTRKGFAFLFVGGTVERKGIDVLLQVYASTFSAADDVALVIKDFGLGGFYRMVSYREQILKIRALKGAPEIVYTDASLTPAQMAALYRSCDCFAFPYRGEGFGIPILEAMACGLPVIVTKGGAADDFLDETTAYLIRAMKRPIGQRVYEVNLVSEGWLLEPDRTALSNLMRRVYENREEARQVGRRASARARTDFTWDRSAEKVIERVSRLALAQR